mmetsp:Transcript_141516/g.368768  ORF Transcript_141516/g.368768 Transcript_141516/m.368768 type:complete len:203 (-) Transcript_141516:1597-2205(-)
MRRCRLTTRRTPPPGACMSSRKFRTPRSSSRRPATRCASWLRSTPRRTPQRHTMTQCSSRRRRKCTGSASRRTGRSISRSRPFLRRAEKATVPTPATRPTQRRRLRRSGNTMLKNSSRRVKLCGRPWARNGKTTTSWGCVRPNVKGSRRRIRSAWTTLACPSRCTTTGLIRSWSFTAGSPRMTTNTSCGSTSCGSWTLSRTR